ncbi:hypothetical protein [Kitasatospora griseola]|uniref:hypothetical protein n=1 Tax=Kitasatospora griseola TaxID=2064 RepID=UPI00166FD38C|nr:hypothetical protein [Kitasatospora griseola]GGR04266.1 hypothetical protein GCM10010195_69690 [Kitasatospora griseola]
MGLLSYFGLGSSGSGAGPAVTPTTTAPSSTGLTGSWPAYDETTAREHHRIAQVPLPAAEYHPDGTRKLSPVPDPQHVSRSFWRN